MTAVCNFADNIVFVSFGRIYDKQIFFTVIYNNFAANIRKVRGPEPYKGKGIKYKGEQIRRKEGKKASK